jgi:hypothetical protein
VPRFTISHHTGAKDGDHYDLLLERGDLLKSWRLRHTHFERLQQVPMTQDHRMLYLDYEGEISNGRGRVAVWDTGAYLEDEWTDGRIRVALGGKRVRLRLRLDRVERETATSEPTWTVTDAAVELRKAAAAFLRGAGLDAAPAPELAELGTALSHEEQKIMAQVDQFAKGGTVEWSLAMTDPELLGRIESQKHRWQHPWLASAREHVLRLGQLAVQLRALRPGASA